LGGAKFIRGGEDVAEHVEVGRLGKVVEIEAMYLLDGVREIRVDFEAVQVADHQQRRVFEIVAVELELAVGGVQIAMLLFVLPGEMALEPNIGPAARAVHLVKAALEGVEGPIRISGGGFVLAEKVAEIEEVLLVSAAFGEVGAFPFVDEVLGRHGRDYQGSQRGCPRNCRTMRDRFTTWGRPPGLRKLTAGQAAGGRRQESGSDRSSFPASLPKERSAQEAARLPKGGHLTFFKVAKGWQGCQRG